MIEIVPYQPKYEEAFRELNKAWIEKYFTMEQADHEILNNPDTYVIDKGGYILVALDGEKPVGVCALIASEHEGYDYELAKMAVDSAYQGRGIGKQLGEAIIQLAKDLGARNIFLESNTVLTTAINLYVTLGFKEITGIKTPYQRCNTLMAVELT